MGGLRNGVSRRTVLAGAAGLGAAGLPGRLAWSASKPIKIGLVTAVTGPLAALFEQGPFVLDKINKSLGHVIVIDGVKHPYEILLRDTESSPNRSSQLAQDLIFNEKIDLMLSFGPPSVAIPVAEQCEANGMPCVNSSCPIDSYFYGRGSPKAGFEWTYNFFLSYNQVEMASVAEWKRLATNKRVGLLLPNDTDGQANARIVPHILKSNGFEVVDPGRFDMPSNFTAQISLFKRRGVEIVEGILPPPQFIAFWNAAAQQGFKPKAVHIGKSSEFPAIVTPLGSRALNLSEELFWTPDAPYSSSLTGGSSRALADDYEKSTGKQWTMVLGFPHALMEVGFSALKRAGGKASAAQIRDAIKDAQYNTIVGPLDFRTGPFPNESLTPVTMGQWRKGTRYPLELLVVDNTYVKAIPVQSAPELIT